jgi:hypothetical protein
MQYCWLKNYTAAGSGNPEHQIINTLLLLVDFIHKFNNFISFIISSYGNFDAGKIYVLQQRKG